MTPFISKELRSDAAMLRDEVLAIIPDMLSKINDKDIDGNDVSKLKFGITCSVARNKVKKSSDIDLVVDSNGFSIETIEYIKTYIKDKFNRSADILFLPLLKNEDKELDKTVESLGLPVNKDSIYKTIEREAIWYDKHIKEINNQ